MAEKSKAEISTTPAETIVEDPAEVEAVEDEAIPETPVVEGAVVSDAVAQIGTGYDYESGAFNL